MKSLIKIVVHGLALVGVAEIYKEYQLRKTLNATDDVIENLNSKVDNNDPSR